MSDPIESQHPNESSAPAQPLSDKKSIARKNREAFLNKLFATDPHSEECFRKICDSGCPRDEFGQLLQATCALMSFQFRPLLNSGDLTKAQLKGLPKRLRTLAGIIKRLNATPLAPINEVLFWPDAPEGTRARAARDYLVKRYEMLPGMLMVYSFHIERFTRIARRTLKRLTLDHIMAIGIVRFVENTTGGPHYGELAELLEQGCLIERKEKSPPKFLTAEGLARLYQRWGSAALGPKDLNLPRIKDQRFL